MKQRILMGGALLVFSAAMLSAADPQLLNLVMPDAQMIGGMNVDQAKTSPFGQYLLTQLAANDQDLARFAAATGFDPTRDLQEVLVASTHGPKPSNLVLARGTFNVDKIKAAALAAGGATETYKGVVIVTDRKEAFAFLSPVLAVGGDIASVRAAIDRQTAPTTLDAALVVKINQLSAVQDAWGIANGPFGAVQPPPTPNGVAIPANAFQKVDQVTGGVKYGAQIVVTSDIQASTPQDATNLSSVLQFMVNLGQMQGQKDPELAALLKAVAITTAGNMVHVSGSVPEATAEKLVQLKPHNTVPNAGPRHMRKL